MSPPGMPLLPIGRSCGRFDSMTALDASFLSIESPTTPMHVGALSIFEGGPFHDPDGGFRREAVRDHVAGRLHLLPGLRRRPVASWSGVGRPVWIDDRDFDIGRHVRFRRLPAPGDERQLAEATAELHMALIDRRHPLWELWFLDGLEDGSVAVVEKIHHAMVDGVADVDLAATLLDLTPDEPVGPPVGWAPRPSPTETQLFVHGLVELVAAPTRWLLHSASLLRSPGSLAAQAEGLADAWWSLGRSEHPVRTSLDATVSARRTLHWVQRPLSPLIAAAHSRDVTLNDLALSAVTAGERRLLAGRDELPIGAAPLALVPVSVRGADQHDASGNRVAALLIPLPVDLDATDARVEAVRTATAHHKDRHVADGSTVLVDAMEAVPAAVLRHASSLVHRQPLVDLVVTNVPGPPCPLWFDGARMTSTVPIVPLAGNLTISVALLSYDGVLSVGVFADAEACPDVSVLVDGIADELDRFTADDGA